VNTEPRYLYNADENEKLRLDNEQLKKKLEVEEFHHKTLYKQWNELNTRMLSSEREFDQFRRKNIFYKYAFYSILILLFPAYYLLTHNKEDRIPNVTVQNSSSQTPKANETHVSKDTQIVNQPPIVDEPATLNEQIKANPDTAKSIVVKPEEKEIIKPDTVRKTIAISKPVAEEPLSEAGRDSVYWQGWNGYYKKIRNPYQRSSEKFTVWLQGWKDGENDSKKVSPDGESTR
jgi:hypothetical protein